MRFTLTLVDDTNDAITIVGDMDMMTFGAPDEQRCPFAASGFFATDEKPTRCFTGGPQGTTVCA